MLIDLESHGREEGIIGLDVSRTVGWLTSLYPMRLETCERNAVDALTSVKRCLQDMYPLVVSATACFATSRAPELAGALTADMIFNYLGQWETMISNDLRNFTVAAESPGPTFSLRNHRPHILELSSLIGGRRLRVACTFNRNCHERASIEELMHQDNGGASFTIGCCSRSHKFGVCF